ncbi:hypothetical protein LAJ19_07655 [Deinococcus taeanensis]|uniref:hypothetical protein n=1 Tax=Deinococcus taeanensis TaxID=2737050 RepID=UPI001CDB6A17|nr:hypothetical protein [Deinococcus taeanensis]UBV41542.1 hypothetical protein LAJ19_07655 [Deinococcus taeanensis]
MKKRMLAALGLTGVLAGCSSSVVVGTTDPVRNFQLLAYQSQYTLPTAYTDSSTGTTYPAGTSIICDNLSTRLSVTLDWEGTISTVGVRLVGRDTGTTRTVYSNPLGDAYSAHPSTYEFTVGAGTAPQRVGTPMLGAQAITVTPVNTFTVKGATFVDVQAASSDGTVSPVRKSVQALPIADCSV